MRNECYRGGDLIRFLDTDSKRLWGKEPVAANLDILQRHDYPLASIDYPTLWPRRAGIVYSNLLLFILIVVFVLILFKVIFTNMNLRSKFLISPYCRRKPVGFCRCSEHDRWHNLLCAATRHWNTDIIMLIYTIFKHPRASTTIGILGIVLHFYNPPTFVVFAPSAAIAHTFAKSI